MSQEILMREILARSRATDWEAARTEWILNGVHLVAWEDSETCLCGHQPIREVCTIVNQITEAEVIVGNCCVKRFLELPSQDIFNSIRRVEMDGTKSFNLKTLTFLWRREVISSDDFWDSERTWRQRIITPYLSALRQRVNEAGINYFRRRDRGAAPLQQP